MFEITTLPARQGDAIWIRWGDEGNPCQMMVDMGTEETGERIRAQILAMPQARRKLELLVVTHVDGDHIGGLLTCLAEADPIPGLKVKDVWFNGFQHLTGGSVAQPGDAARKGLEPLGPAQGERLSSWLRKQVWNKKFKGAPVQRVPGQTPPTVKLPDDLEITILGPTPLRLERMVDIWKEEVEAALKKGKLKEVSPGLEELGAKAPPDLVEAGDLEELAETDNPADIKPANGTSIALLLDYKGCKVVLSGDAFANDLVDAIKAVGGAERVELAAFKLPHHCSKKNVLKSLVKSVDCGRWLISTDGTEFHHPDPAAVARVIAYSKVRTPLLSFNVPSTYNDWWNKPEWKKLYDYRTEYGTKEAGLTLQFELESD
jgi:beta-lactamase superfamily II metal-dependent hydrolase